MKAGYGKAGKQTTLSNFFTATTTTNYNYLWDTDSEGKVIPSKPSGKGAPPQAINMMGNLDKPEPAPLAALNFKVPEAFKVAVKTYAAQQGKSMNRILQEAFEAYRHTVN